MERSYGMVGFSWGEPTAYDAERAAIKACGDAQCEIVITVQGGCAAIAERRAPAPVSRSTGASGTGASGPIEYLAAVGRDYGEVTERFFIEHPKNDGIRVLAWTCNLG